MHIGDSRAYRLSSNRLTVLTTDHVRQDGPNRSRALYRALGVEAELRLQYTAFPMARHDRFLLCSDGLHGWLTDETIADTLSERSAPADTARALVTTAIESGTRDHCTALVLDVLELPTAELSSLATASLLSDGRYARLFAAIDEVEGGGVVLKFPKPRAADAAGLRGAFEREAWVGSRVHSAGLARAVATLHRDGIIHRDIKPDNVILEYDAALKLIDPAALLALALLVSIARR